MLTSINYILIQHSHEQHSLTDKQLQVGHHSKQITKCTKEECTRPVCIVRHSIGNLIVLHTCHVATHNHTTAYAHTHAHARTHTHTHTCMHTHTCAHTHTCMHTHTHAHTHTCAYLSRKTFGPLFSNL